MLQRAGVVDCIGSDMVFDNLEDAYLAFEAQAGTAPRTSPPPAPATEALAIPAG
jgi:hypothetical protein